MHEMIRRPFPLALAVAEKALIEFSNQWLAGLQPQLSLETGSDGQILVNSRVAAGDVPTRAPVVPRCAEEAQGPCQAGEAPQHPRPHHRRGPSYQRRLQRRAAARTAAVTADKAIQTVLEHDATPTHHPTQVAGQVLPAPAQSNQQQHFWSLLRDELCPDTDYSTSVQGVLSHHPPYPPHQSRGPHITQVDGNSTLGTTQDQDQDLEERERVWSCKCCTYETFFDTEDDLHHHHDSPG